MKILMVLDHEFPADIRVENEIEALTKAGHEVHIACYTMKGDKKEDSFNNAAIHRKPISRFIYKTSVGALMFPIYFNFWRSFIDTLTKAHSFDAIHIHDLPLAKVGYEFAQKKNIPFTLDLHENWPALLEMATHTKSLLGRILSNNKQWRQYELKYCNLATNVIVVVNEAKNRLVGLGIESSKIKIVSNTLNTNHFDLSNEKPNKDFITLLYAGGINRHRGLQYVIKGMKFLSEREIPVRLQILGPGSYINDLKRLVKKEGVENMVDFIGWKPYSELIKYIGKANVCLIPHVKSEHTDSTIPHKLFQYMYAGKPIIASNCLPIERIINDTKSGIIYRFDDANEFAQSVIKLIDSSSMYNEFVENGRKNVLAEYTWEKDSKVLNQIYGG